MDLKINDVAHGGTVFPKLLNIYIDERSIYSTIFINGSLIGKSINHIEGLELKRTISTFSKWAISTFRVLSNHIFRVRSHALHLDA